MFILVVAGFFTTISQPPSTLLLGMGRPNLVALFTTITTVLYIPLCYFFVKRYGGTGAAVSWFLVSLLNFLLLNYFAWKILKIDHIKESIKLIRLLAIPVGVCALLCWALSTFGLSFLNIRNVAGYVLVAAIYWYTVWQIGLDEFAKRKTLLFINLFIGKFRAPPQAV